MTDLLPVKVRGRDERRAWGVSAPPPRQDPDDPTTLVLACHGQGCHWTLRLTYASAEGAERALADLAFQAGRYEWAVDPPLCAACRLKAGDEVDRLRAWAWYELLDDIRDATEHGDGYIEACERDGVERGIIRHVSINVRLILRNRAQEAIADALVAFFVRHRTLSGNCLADDLLQMTNGDAHRYS
jgi:hypothetical protein